MSSSDLDESENGTDQVLDDDGDLLAAVEAQC
jgi:hypothetical protein